MRSRCDLYKLLVDHSVVVFHPGDETDEFGASGSQRHGFDRGFGSDWTSTNSFWRAITVCIRIGKVGFSGDFFTASRNAQILEYINQ